MIDKNRLQAKCSTWNIPLTGAQLDLLDRYAELLVGYNEKVNLTAITSPEGIEDRHFADSLLFAAQPEVSGRLVDVGTGAGFPGIVAKIYKPDLELTLMEPTGKRVDFLRLCRAGSDRRRVCEGTRRGGRPQDLARAVRRGQRPRGGGTACAVRILPAAGQSRRAVYRDEGPRGRRRSKSRRQRAEKAGRPI